jgi:tellurite resistance protein TehA-like permease
MSTYSPDGSEVLVTLALLVVETPPEYESRTWWENVAVVVLLTAMPVRTANVPEATVEADTIIPVPALTIVGIPVNGVSAGVVVEYDAAVNVYVPVDDVAFK